MFLHYCGGSLTDGSIKTMLFLFFTEQSVTSPSCAIEMQPLLKDMASNATLISADLTKMTILNFLQLITDSELRQVLLKALENSIQFAADFSMDTLQR